MMVAGDVMATHRWTATCSERTGHSATGTAGRTYASVYTNMNAPNARQYTANGISVFVLK